jgi:hypothetical protein
MLHLSRILIIVVGFCAASITNFDAAVRASTLYNVNLPNPSASVTWRSEVNGLEAAVYGPRAVDLEGSSTGSATLTPGRILQIQNNIPGGAGVPVLPITPP